MRTAMLTGVAVAVMGVAGMAEGVVTISSSGATPADIQVAVDDFRAALGGVNNGAAAGSQGSGRREINWDGVPDSFSSPNALPGDFFNVNSPRGLVMSTAGTGFLVSADAANPTATPTRFTDLNPGHAGRFTPFSEQRIFTAAGSTVLDIRFFVPGTNIPATVLGFGAVFLDVGFDGVTFFQMYDANDAPVGGVAAPTSVNGGLSFIGMVRDTAEVARVRIVTGTQALDTVGTAGDYVAMDDFIYGEPVPAPGVGGAIALGMLAMGRRRRVG